MGATPWKFESSSGHQWFCMRNYCIEQLDNQFMTKIRNKKLTASSKKWLARQMNDPYVARARQEGYRSRAAYKLLEIQDKFTIFDKNSVVLDLGAAPGGWSQVASEIVKRVVALDLLEMPSLPNVEFMQGDFMNENDIQTLIQLLHNEKVDVILSDMAPNTCGIKQVDHLRIICLLESVYDFCQITLKPGGILVSKVFQGGSCTELLAKMKQHFTCIKHFKPQSSRKESPETYIVARNYHA